MLFLFLACQTTDPTLEVDVRFHRQPNTQNEESEEQVPNYEDPAAEPIEGNIELFEIVAKDFWMGANEGDTFAFPDEVVHWVELDQNFYISQTEVTIGQFESVMGYDPMNGESCDDCPVANVSWHEAAAFANALSELQGAQACFTCEGSGQDVRCDVAVNPYECAGFRLPTEAEWELAARSDDDTLYAGSDDLIEVGWWNAVSNMEAHPVASLAPNGNDLYDMSGNIREWVFDWYLPLTEETATNPVVYPGEGVYPVERGGSFACPADHLRVSARFININGESSELGERIRDTHVGFRIAHSILE